MEFSFDPGYKVSVYFFLSLILLATVAAKGLVHNGHTNHYFLNVFGPSRPLLVPMQQKECNIAHTENAIDRS